jgi:ribosome-binding protein aMBF1 (putative translation factor)
MNCNLCGCEGAYLAHKVGRKVITICGDCWYYEDKTERKREREYEYNK